VHGTTSRIVAEHFAEERASLLRLPAGRFDAVLRVERRVSHEGMVSVGGNLYSVPDGTRSRVLEVETTAEAVRIHENQQLIAIHTLLHGRRQRSLLAGHRQARRAPTEHCSPAGSTRLNAPGHRVAQRALDVYATVAQRLAAARHVAQGVGR
jgi:hypothetical protein